MKKELWFELKRKAIHVLSVLFIIIYVLFSFYFGHYIGLGALGIILILFLIIEYVRIVLKKKIPFFHGLWRKSERNRLGGQVYIVIGAIIVFAVFDFRIAVAALLMTVFGDMIAPLVGIAYGKSKIKGVVPRKSWEGTFAEFVVNLIIGFILLNNIIIIFAMALTATAVEVWITSVDDNLTIPVSAGLVGQILVLAEPDWFKPSPKIIRITAMAYCLSTICARLLN